MDSFIVPSVPKFLWIFVLIHFEKAQSTNVINLKKNLLQDIDVESQVLTNDTDTPRKINLRNTNGSWKTKIKNRIFILSWIQKYDKDTAIGDAIAGITLGMTIIPQAIAYAALAGLPSQYGLYSAFMGMI